jgi:hypothetical protein
MVGCGGSEPGSTTEQFADRLGEAPEAGPTTREFIVNAFAEHFAYWAWQMAGDVYAESPTEVDSRLADLEEISISGLESEGRSLFVAAREALAKIKTATSGQQRGFLQADASMKLGLIMKHYEIEVDEVSRAGFPAITDQMASIRGLMEMTGVW